MLLFLLFTLVLGGEKRKPNILCFFIMNHLPNCHIIFPWITSLTLYLYHRREGLIGYFVFYTLPTQSLSLYLMFPPSSWMELRRSHQHLLSDFCESHQPTYLIATNSLHWKLHHHFFLFLYLPHFQISSLLLTISAPPFLFTHFAHKFKSLVIIIFKCTATKVHVMFGGKLVMGAM